MTALGLGEAAGEPWPRQETEASAVAAPASAPDLDQDLLADAADAALGAVVFHLEDIRRAHALEVAPRDLTEGQRAMWDRGRGLSERFATAIETVPLTGSLLPGSAAYAGAALEGDKVRLRYLFFPTLWPSEVSQATARAVIELDPETGSATGWVIPS